MKKSMLLCLFLGIVSIGFSQNVKVKFVSANLIYNNSVGNEWSYSSKINGEYIQRNSTKELNVFESFKIECSAMERDKYSDYGDNEKIIYLSGISDEKPTIVTVEVIVREDRGRYAGNTAKWAFKFQITK